MTCLCSDPSNTTGTLKVSVPLTSIPAAWWVPTAWAGLVKGGTPGCSWMFSIQTVLPGG